MSRSSITEIIPRAQPYPYVNVIAEDYYAVLSYWLPLQLFRYFTNLLAIVLYIFCSVFQYTQICFCDNSCPTSARTQEMGKMHAFVRFFSHDLFLGYFFCRQDFAKEYFG